MTLFGANYAMLFITVYFFVLSSNKDPGYLKKPDNISFLVRLDFS